ncbi:MAG: hypothetical protein HY581_12700 [Nitrospirae bacterium]|nr:hypothetical protein [Nitrospirota bacterium]
MTYDEALRLLELFQKRDYAQGRPHFYIRSWRSNSWVRPKGVRILASSNELAILDWESEEWETIPFKDVDFGLW